MREHDWLADRFEENRTHLRAVAYRMLGSLSEADDAVQEAWLRLSRSDSSGVDNLGGCLTTVVARVSLDMLRSRKSRREEPLGAHVSAARQLASRARRRVKGAAAVPDADLIRQREVVDAFLAASRDGDFDALLALLALLDPDVVLRADGAAVQAGASSEVRGAPAVADTFSGRARFAQPALVDGAPGAVWAPGGRPRVVFGFTIGRRKIVEIDLLADPTRLVQLDVVVLDE